MGSMEDWDIGESLRNSVMDSLWNSGCVSHSARNSVYVSVWESVRTSVRDVRDSVWAYVWLPVIDSEG